MAYTIISESYGPRKPKIICTADSLDDLAGLDCAEGSEATVGETTYVLDRVNGWVEPGGGNEPFIVTLTPTEADFSGTMDKTVAEINEAYEAGQKIVFRTMMSETTYMDVDCTARWYNGSTYPSFNGFILTGSDDTLIFAFTGATNDATEQTYGTKIYPLTPMS